MHLQGTLHISQLENVKDVGDASEAQLNSKENLKALLLEWSTDISDAAEVETDAAEVETDAAEDETRVLDMLKPHQKLEELTIAGYGGTQFPIWLGDFSFSKLVRLKFASCYMCTSLPSVGQLPFLKHLYISGMGGVKSVGPEFYGKSCSVPFPSLEILCFEDMPAWEEWIPRGADREVDGFPKLRMLSLGDCSKLQGTLPQRLPLLEELVIERCFQLIVTIHCLPSLSELQINGCKSVVFSSPNDLGSLNLVSSSDMSNQVKIQYLQDIRSLNRLQISRCPQLLSLVIEEEHDQQQPELPCSLQFLELAYCEGLQKIPQALLTLSSLSEMRISSCASLVSFPQAALPSQLRTVVIYDCNALESLPEAWMGNSDSSLRRLMIWHCNSLVSFPEAALPSQLRTIKIQYCNSLKSLPEAWMQNSSASLESLDIALCHSLSYIARIRLPPRLKQLIIENCRNLRTLIREQDICRSSSGSTLELLRVGGCSKLESLAERLDNTSLEEITIGALENLKSLPVGLYNLHHLQRIYISSCPNLESFPEGGLPSTKLTTLKIWRCENLKALPNGIHNLTSLQSLVISDCPSLGSFPEDGFPTNLQSLEVHDLQISKPLFEWGLNRFTSLREFKISGGCPDLVSSPRFPASLTKLWILDMPNLKRLSSIGQNLTSLEKLRLQYCPKLKYFSKQGLPKSLLRLDIEDCPLIEKRCRKDKGKYWPMITHIPYVEINYRFVFQEDSSSDSS